MRGHSPGSDRDELSLSAKGLIPWDEYGGSASGKADGVAIVKDKSHDFIPSVASFWMANSLWNDGGFDETAPTTSPPGNASCQDGGSGDGGRATMERVPNRRWTESTVGSKELVEVEQDRAGIATMA